MKCYCQLLPCQHQYGQRLHSPPTSPGWVRELQSEMHKDTGAALSQLPAGLMAAWVHSFGQGRTMILAAAFKWTSNEMDQAMEDRLEM